MRRTHALLLGLVAVAACGGPTGPGTTVSLTVGYHGLVADHRFVPHQGGAPCAVGDLAGCTAACDRSPWACTLAGDAERARANARAAAKAYARACAGNDPDGCAEVALKAIARAPRGASALEPYAILGATCTEGLSERACLAYQWMGDRARGLPREDHDTATDLTVTMMYTACYRLNHVATCAQTNAHDKLCELGFADECAENQRVIAERAAMGPAIAERDRLAAASEADEALHGKQRACERLHPGAICDADGTYSDPGTAAEVERLLRASPPPADDAPRASGGSATRTDDASQRGRLSAVECDDIMSYVCHKLTVDVRRTGVTDEAGVEAWEAACPKTFHELRDFCPTVTCGPRWKRCMTYESASIPEFNACARFAHAC